MTKSDAEDILGTAVVARENTVYYCSFVETGFTSKVPTNHQVNMSVWYSTSPDPSQYAVLLKNIADHRNPAAAMKEITDFADAAIWIWTEGWGGILDAFNGGTIHVEVTISGLPQDAALQNAKALSARVLGRTGGTGYVYLGTPKRNASASALQPASVAGSLPAATKGTIHKSKAYWDGYRSAIIRQVFEGNFGHERLDSSTQFRLLFNSYVESFSKSCHAYLPVRHEAVALSQATTKSDRTGNVVSQQELQSWTVEVDSRFAPEYREYAGSLFSTSGETLAGALAIMSGKVSPTAYFDPGTDVIKFFETETCQSAAMRQLSENLLRAAEGRSPLQDAGDHNP
jgi:hypothetical protein